MYHFFKSKQRSSVYLHCLVPLSSLDIEISDAGWPLLSFGMLLSLWEVEMKVSPISFNLSTFLGAF
jgi:hypothetical protein